MNDVLAVVETSLAHFGLAPLHAAKRLGLSTVLLTDDPGRYRPGRPAGGELDDLVAEIRTADTADPHAVVAALDDLIPRLAGVYSVTDYNVHVAAEVAHRLGLPGLSPRAAAVARDKPAMREACAAAGVPGPRFRWVPEAAGLAGAVAHVGLPCIVKPAGEAGSIDVRLCRTPAEAAAQFARIAAVPTDYRGRPRRPGALIEEYLAGPEVSVETVQAGGARIVLGVTDKLLGPLPHFVELGQCFPSVLPEATRRQCAEVAEAALDAVGHTFGAAHVEVKVTGRGARLIEVNARMAGSRITDLVRAGTGVDLPEVVVALHTGRPVVIDPRPAGAAAEFQLTARSDGVLRAVHGLELCRRVPGLVAVVIEAEPGDRVRVARDNVDPLGHVVTVGADAAEALLRAMEAVRQLEPEIETAG